MKNFYTAVTAAIVGAVVGGLLAFLVNERNIQEARNSQKLELEVLASQWANENAKSDAQILLMQASIDEMKKNYLFSQEKHLAEMKAVYEMINSNTENTRLLVSQNEKFASAENDRYSKNQRQRKSDAALAAINEYVKAAELLRAAQLTLQSAFCNEIDNTQVVRSSSGGITSTSVYPRKSYDCTPKMIAEVEHNTARAKFVASMKMALNSASSKDREKIRRLETILDVDLKNLKEISDDQYQAAISDLMKK